MEPGLWCPRWIQVVPQGRQEVSVRLSETGLAVLAPPGWLINANRCQLQQQETSGLRKAEFFRLGSFLFSGSWNFQKRNFPSVSVPLPSFVFSPTHLDRGRRARLVAAFTSRCVVKRISPQVCEPPERPDAFQYIKTLQPSISTSLIMFKSWRWELHIS